MRGRTSIQSPYRGAFKEPAVIFTKTQNQRESKSTTNHKKIAKQPNNKQKSERQQETRPNNSTKRSTNFKNTQFLSRT